VVLAWQPKPPVRYQLCVFHQENAWPLLLASYSKFSTNPRSLGCLTKTTVTKTRFSAFSIENTCTCFAILWPRNCRIPELWVHCAIIFWSLNIVVDPYRVSARNEFELNK
jgi:hypothetical protein